MNKSMRVLVTGGAGFIGSHIVDRLISDGFEVRIIDNLSTGRLENIQRHLGNGKADFIKGDIRNASLVRKSVDDVGVVVHLAALTSVPFSLENPSLTFDVNLLGTLHLLRSSINEGVRKFVFVSSCSVCGEPESLPVTEEAQTNPISPYAESKIAAERYCLGFQERGFLGSVVLRFFNVYGPRQGMNDYSGVITRFIDCCRQRLPLAIHGDGSQTRDFVSVYDTVEAVLASIKRRDADGKVFNIGSGTPTSINELAKTVSELAGVDLELSYEKSRDGDIKDSYADISRAKKILGYEPKVCLRDGLRALLEERKVAA